MHRGVNSLASDYAPCWVLPGTSAADIPIIRHHHSCFLLINSIAGLEVIWRKYPGALITPCIMPEFIPDPELRVHSKKPFHKFMAALLKTEVTRAVDPWANDPLLPSKDALWDLVRTLGTDLELGRNTFGPLLQGYPGSSNILQCLALPRNALNTYVRIGNLVHAAWASGLLLFVKPPHLESLHGKIMEYIGTKNISAQVVHISKEGLWVELAGDSDTLTLPSRVETSAFIKSSPRMILQKDKEMHLLIHSEQLAMLGVCAYTLHLLGWTLVDKTSFEVVSLRRLSKSSITLDECVNRLTNPEEKAEEEADEHVVDDWENITGDSPDFASSTPYVLLQRKGFVLPSDSWSMETIMTSLENEYPDYSQDMPHLSSLHLPWTSSVAFPSAAWASSFTKPEVFYSSLTPSLISNRSRGRLPAQSLSINSVVAPVSELTRQSDTATISPDLLVHSDSTEFSMAQGDNSEINISVIPPMNPELSRSTRTADRLRIPPRVAIASKVMEVPTEKMFTPLLAIGTLPTYLDQLGLVGARTCALWITGISQCYRHFKPGPLECARGVLFSLLELFAAQFRKEREGAPLEHLPLSKRRLRDFFSLLIVEEIRAKGTGSPRGVFLNPIIKWAKSGFALGDIEALFINNYGLESTLIRLQSCLQWFHSRTLLLEIFPELKLVSLIGLASGCCSMNDTHRDSSAICYKSKPDGLGPVYILIPDASSFTLLHPASLNRNLSLSGRCIRLYTSADSCPGSTTRPYEAPVFLTGDLVSTQEGRSRARLCHISDISGSTAVTQSCSITGLVDQIVQETRVPLTSLSPPSSQAALHAATRLAADHPALFATSPSVFACWERNSEGPLVGYKDTKAKIPLECPFAEFTADHSEPRDFGGCGICEEACPQGCYTCGTKYHMSCVARMEDVLEEVESQFYFKCNQCTYSSIHSFVRNGDFAPITMDPTGEERAFGVVNTVAGSITLFTPEQHGRCSALNISRALPSLVQAPLTRGACCHICDRDLTGPPPTGCFGCGKLVHWSCLTYSTPDIGVARSLYCLNDDREDTGNAFPLCYNCSDATLAQARALCPPNATRSPREVSLSRQWIDGPVDGVMTLHLPTGPRPIPALIEQLRDFQATHVGRASAINCTTCQKPIQPRSR